MEWIPDNLWWIIPCVLLVFFLAGYVLPKKKHLKTGQYELQFVYKGKKEVLTKNKKIRKDIWSVIIPFCPVKAYVNCYNPDYVCDFPNFIIESAGKSWSGRRFRIKSLGNVQNLNNYIINNRSYTNTGALLHDAFMLSCFTIETHRDFARKGTVRIMKKK